MEQQKVDMFMMMNNKYFPEAQIPFIRQHLLNVDESKEGILHTLQFKDPIISLVLSLMVGSLHHRFFCRRLFQRPRWCAISPKRTTTPWHVR